MEENCLAYGIEILESEWEKTPTSVKKLVEQMGQQIKQSEKELAELKAQQQELLEKINRTSLNRATLPVDVHPSGYGVRVVALVALLSGLYRHSQRMVQSAMQDLIWNIHVLGYSQ